MDIYESKQDYAYNGLKRLILNGKLKPNEQISRKELGERLNVGNTPIREAILRLEREGLFRTIPQSGTFVTRINPQIVQESYFVRKSIEQLIFEEAFELATKQEIKKLEQMLVIQNVVFDGNDSEMFFTFDDEFHKYFYDIAKKRYTWSWLETISAPLMRCKYLQAQSEEMSWHKIQTDHETIVKALKSKSREKYYKLIEVHLEHLKPDMAGIAEKYPDYFEE